MSDHGFGGLALRRRLSEAILAIYLALAPSTERPKRGLIEFRPAAMLIVGTPTAPLIPRP